jgi:hypothetical protein
MLEKSHLAQTRRDVVAWGLSDGGIRTVTAYLCAARLLFTVLHYVHILTRTDSIPFIHWLAGIGTILVIYATYEMRRWGRLALVAISAFFLIDNLLGLLRLASVPRSTLSTLLGEGSMAEVWLGASGSSWVLHGIRFALSATTVIWFTRPFVAAQFERGKSSVPRSSQVAIASFFATIAATNLYLCGTAQAIMRMLTSIPH